MTTIKKQMPMYTTGFVDPFFAAKGAILQSLFCIFWVKKYIKLIQSKLQKPIFIFQVVVIGIQAVMCFHLV